MRTVKNYNDVLGREFCKKKYAIQRRYGNNVNELQNNKAIKINTFAIHEYNFIKQKEMKE